MILLSFPIQVLADQATDIKQIGIHEIAGDSLSFETYLNKVGKNNLGYMADRLNVDIAEAEVLAAKVLPDPSLDFEANKETFTLGLSYTLELGKRRARTKLARSQSEMEKLALEAGFHELRAQAAELFLDAILQRELLQVKKDSYQYMVQLSVSDSLRFVSGEITENDARQSRLEAIGLLNDVFDQEAAYHASVVELQKLMGTSSDSILNPKGNWESLKRDFTLQQLLETGKVNRVDLWVANKNIEVNQKALKLARAERRPDFDLSLSYERDWNHFLPQARYATIGVSIPLSFSVINKGTIKSARFQRDQAVIQQQDAELQVTSEIKQAWYTFIAARKKVAQYQSGVLDESLKVLEGMVYKYKRGDASILDVLLSQRSYNEVCQDYLETMKGYCSSLVELEHACGIWDILL